jgi:hypothetical protein
MVTTAALLQIDAYSIVVLYSLWIGGIDYVIPVKAALVLSLFFVLYKAVVDFSIVLNNSRAWKKRGADLSEVELSISTLAFEVFSLIGGVVVVSLFLLRSISNVNLTSLGWEAKALVSISFLWALWFNVHAIRDIQDLRRKGAVPQVLSGEANKNEEANKK